MKMEASIGVLAMLLSGCTGSSDVVAGGETGDAGTGQVLVAPTAPQAVLDEVIDPVNALVEDFGGEWQPVEEWPVEADVSYSTGCSAFDELVDIENWGPTVAVWQTTDSELVQTVADLNWGADDYVSTVRTIPETCPVITISGATIDVSAMTTSEPDAAAYKLSAYPVPDPGLHGSAPRLDPDRVAWVAVVARANVVSRLTIAPGSDLDEPQFDSLIAAMRLALDNAPVDADGPIVEPPRPPKATGTLTDVILRFDGQDCRNSGSAEAAGITWSLNDLVPLDWRDLGQVSGTLTMNGESATFAGADGTVLDMTSGPVAAYCASWDAPEPDR